MSDSTLRNAIVGRDAVLTRSTLDGALLGNNVVVEGFRGRHDTGRSFRGDREGLIHPRDPTSRSHGVG